MTPFEMDGDLVCISSAHAVPDNVATDLLTLQSQGEQEFHEFVENRLHTKETSFHEPIKKKKVTTFTCLKKESVIKSKTSKEIKVTAQRNMFGQLLMVSQAHNIDLAKVTSYPLNHFPWSLATSEGSMMKTGNRRHRNTKTA